MKIKLDEHLPTDVFELLVGAGHDVHTVRDEKMVGDEDDVLFAAASMEGRLLITQDLDFSDIRKFRPGTHPGVVLIRTSRSEPRSVDQAIARCDRGRSDRIMGWLFCRARRKEDSRAAA